MAGRPPNTPNKMTPTAKATFLLALARLGNHRAAAASIGVHVMTTIRHRQADPDFAEACEKALGRLGEELVSTARMLAIEGVAEPIFDRAGMEIGTKRRYSERVLLRWLARLMPEDWNDKVQVDQTIAGKVEVEHKGAIRVQDLAPKQRRLVRELLGDGAEDPSRN